MQSLLFLQEGVSLSMLEDIYTFNYTWLLDNVRRVNWGEDVTNTLLVGMPDVVTPAHYDILENLYVQVGLVILTYLYSILRQTANGKRQIAACSWFSSLFLESLNKSIRKIENNSHVHDKRETTYTHFHVETANSRRQNWSSRPLSLPLQPI